MLTVGELLHGEVLILIFGRLHESHVVCRRIWVRRISIFESVIRTATTTVQQYKDQLVKPL
jgi:hypothetical protein